MPIFVNCPCGIKLNAPDNLVGKSVKCPKCARVVKVPGPAGKAPAAAPSRAPVPQPPKAAPPVARVQPRKPAQSPPSQVETLEEVNEKAAPARARTMAPQQDIPEYLKKRVASELEEGEKIIWIGQADPKIMFVRGLFYPLVGIVMATIVGGMVWSFFSRAEGQFGGKEWIIFVVFGVVAVVSMLMPFIRRWGAKRSCYALTSRRCLIWYGLGSHETYLPSQLTGMRRRGSWFFGGDAGDLVFRSVTTITTTHRRRGPSSTTSSTTYYGFLGIRNLGKVEAMVRETLVNRFLAKLNAANRVDED